MEKARFTKHYHNPLPVYKTGHAMKLADVNIRY
jgi:hypothetical protein